jgi:tetratricopeptide (TPR) repeat protein
MGHLNYKHHNLEEAAPLLELASQRFRRQGEQEKALKAELARIDCLAQTGEELAKDCLEELQLVKNQAKSECFWEVFQSALDVEAHQLDRLGDLQGVRAVLREAETFLDKGRAEAQCKARAMVALNIYFGSPEKGLRFARDSAEIALRTTKNELILYSLNRLILVLHYQGLLQTSEGRKALAEAESRLGTCGDLLLKFHIQLNPAVWLLEIGELDSARTAFEALQSLVKGPKARDAQARLLLNIGELELAAHDFPKAVKAFRKVADISPPHSPHFFRTLTSAGLGLCGLQVGDLAGARRREAELPALPEFWTFDPTVVVTFKARMLLKRRDPERAVDLLSDVRGRVRERLVPAWLRLTLEEARIKGKLKPGSASSVVEEGLEVATSLGLEKRARQFERLKKTL